MSLESPIGAYTVAPRALSSGHSTNRWLVDEEVGFSPMIKAARRGDGRAFSQVHKWLSGRVLSFAQARGVEDPEGLTNEVFLSVFSQVHNFRGSESAFVGWVFHIARNKVIDCHRRSSIRPTMSEEKPNSSDVVESAEDQYLSGVASPQLREMLSAIEDGQREVIMMRVVAGLSFKEIGAALGKRPGAAKEQYRRGIASIQRAMP